MWSYANSPMSVVVSVNDIWTDASFPNCIVTIGKDCGQSPIALFPQYSMSNNQS